MIAQKTVAWAELQKIPVWFKESTTSTNTIAKEELLSNAFASIYVTEKQTNGRGRQQNIWLQSETGGQLFSSWVFNLDHAPQPILSPLVGLALYQALEKTWGSLFSLKAPNDIYLGDKKLAGILIENIQASGRHRLIIGIGLNVLSKPDLETASCLKDQLNPAVIEQRWPQFLDSLFANLNTCSKNSSLSLSKPQCQDLLAALNRFSLLKEAYEQVLSDGSLKTKTSFINWSEL